MGMLNVWQLPKDYGQWFNPFQTSINDNKKHQLEHRCHHPGQSGTGQKIRSSMKVRAVETICTTQKLLTRQLYVYSAFPARRQTQNPLHRNTVIQ